MSSLGRVGSWCGWMKGWHRRRELASIHLMVVVRGLMGGGLLKVGFETQTSQSGCFRAFCFLAFYLSTSYPSWSWWRECWQERIIFLNKHSHLTIVGRLFHLVRLSNSSTLFVRSMSLSLKGVCLCTKVHGFHACAYEIHDHFYASPTPLAPKSS